MKLRQSERPDARARRGLALDLHNAGEVTLAARLLAARRARQRDAHDDGLLVQRQAARSRELRIRVADDATFGPVISFGQGGTTADVVHDVAADLPPLNLALARGLIARTRVAAMLARLPRHAGGGCRGGGARRWCASASSSSISPRSPSWR